VESSSFLLTKSITPRDSSTLEMEVSFLSYAVSARLLRSSTAGKLDLPGVLL